MIEADTGPADLSGAAGRRRAVLVAVRLGVVMREVADDVTVLPDELLAAA